MREIGKELDLKSPFEAERAGQHLKYSTDLKPRQAAAAGGPAGLTLLGRRSIWARRPTATRRRHSAP